jgi:UDPglucose 6-dehydrogenase
MRVCVIGAGYVGLATGACLAKLGHKVTFIDIDEEKLEKIRRRESPVYEPKLDEILKTIDFKAINDLDHAVKNSNVSFICVGTQPDNTSEDFTNLEQVKQVVEAIGKALRHYHLVVVKSTVLPGTTEEIVLPLLEKHGKKLGNDFTVCVNPEFLREGSAVEDSLHPDRIIIGQIDRKGGDILVELYKDLACPILRFDLRTAEMIKYASNAFLASKVSFINEMGNICKKLGIDVYEVVEGMSYDERIGNKFLNAGIGFGGSCLPKDLRTLVAWSKKIGCEPGVLEAAANLNEKQPLRIIELLKRHIPDLRDRDVGILGLAFKPDTDDVRESPAVKMVNALLDEGARVKAYDPQAMRNFKKLFPQIGYASPVEVLQCEAILILTDWGEFEHLDYKGKLVIDGRRITKAKEASVYEGVCW